MEAPMALRTLSAAALLVALSWTTAAAQDARTVVAAAAKAMGTETLNSITYSGTARNGAFGQSKSIGNPMGPVNLTQITQYTRTINFEKGEPAALVSRATGPTQPPTVPGVPAPMPGVFNQNITHQQLGAGWNQALKFWTTPWGFVKGAAAAVSDSSFSHKSQGGQSVLSYSPPHKSPSGQPYRVTGYINSQNLVTKVETHVENAVVGDLLHEFEYSNYQNMNGVQVPTRIVQRQAGMATFEANITAATPNPSNLTELLTVPPAPPRGGGPGGPAGAAPAAGRGAGGAPQPAAPAVEKLGDGAFKIGGNYAALAVDMGDHIDRKSVV